MPPRKQQSRSERLDPFTFPPYGFELQEKILIKPQSSLNRKNLKLNKQISKRMNKSRPKVDWRGCVFLHQTDSISFSEVMKIKVNAAKICWGTFSMFLKL